uniref:Uncharacterized protein n=1 Tax=Rhipicephalus zambeziensis TaxID=60191 RepID=A0A224Y610_9ACAR
MGGSMASKTRQRQLGEHHTPTLCSSQKPGQTSAKCIGPIPYLSLAALTDAFCSSTRWFTTNFPLYSQLLAPTFVLSSYPNNRRYRFIFRRRCLLRLVLDQ